MNKRHALRFETLFPVIISSESFGECNATARNISASGILVEVSEPLPLGTQVRVHFALPESRASIIARGEVKNHYFLNYAARDGQRSMSGMGIRFHEFETERLANPTPNDIKGTGLAVMRILH